MALVGKIELKADRDFAAETEGRILDLFPFEERGNSSLQNSLSKETRPS